jgi:hypothetical protein
MIGDARLRALYRLAERVDGPALDRVREAIRRRRAQLEESAMATPPAIPPTGWKTSRADSRWVPEPERFEPLGADAVPRTVRRAGERGLRVAARRPAGA